MSKKYVIVGAGIAGLTAIKEIRSNDLGGEIMLVGDEGYYPYNRIRLSKSLLNSLDENKILMQKKVWYEEQNVDLYLDNGVVSIDSDAKRVILADGKVLKYDELLIANGASNFIPPIGGVSKKGVYTLRNLSDTLAINEGLKNYSRVLNIGGGIQGLELAWIFKQMGKEVVIVEMMDRLMPRQLDEIASDILIKAVKAQNIEILLGRRVLELLGDDTVSSGKLDSGDEIGCDMVNIAVGIRPNIDIATKTDIKCDRGIIVNDKMQTNIENIYAAGDVVELNNHILGLWNIAIAHGKIAGKNMTVSSDTYENITPVTTLNAFGVNLFSMGDIEDTEETIVVSEYNDSEGLYNKVLIKANRVIGAIVVGNIRLSPLLKSAIEKKIDLSGVDFKAVTFDELVSTIKERK